MNIIESMKEKFNLMKTWQKISLFIALLLLFEAFSFISFFTPVFNIIFFVLLNLVFLFLAIKKSELAIFIIFSELIISSMGYMFFLDIAGFHLSIRMSLWLILLVVYLFKLLFQIKESGAQALYWQRIKNFKFLGLFSFLGFFVFIALAKALISQTPLLSVFHDFNSWLFFLLLFPVLSIVDLENEKIKNVFKNIILASLIYLSLKTLILLAIFSHNLSWATSVYTWLRGSLMAEITINDFWSRIFMQSQIFSGAAFFLVFSYSQSIGDKFFSKKNITLIALAGLFLSTLILSFSRSFWLALILVVSLSLLLTWISLGFKKTISSVLYLFSSLIFALLLIYFVSILPISSSGQIDFNKGLSDRISQDSSEPALASRWSLLPVLWQEIKTAPVLGQGFGAELVYISSDPRVLENNPGGEYRTFAFEWGYLDIWLKMGLLGLFAYFLLLSRLVISGLKRGLSSFGVFWGLSLSLIFLSIVNFFTPYLNHPLGIGLIILSTCIIQKNEVYLKTNIDNIKK